MYAEIVYVCRATVKGLCENPRFIILEIPDEERAQYEL